MTTYVLRRLLLMIPTLFGVSFVVWLVLTSAPAPPIAAQAPGSTEDGQGTGDAGGLSQSIKVYRAQYALDKPAIFNTYYGLETDEVRATLAVAESPADEVEFRDRNRAREDLINWGYYAVPHLVEIAARAEDELRIHALRWFTQNAQRVALASDTGRLSSDERVRNAYIVAENANLELLAWDPADEGAAAAKIEAARRWLHGHADAYPEGPSAAAVAAALDAGNDAFFEQAGDTAVAGLVAVIRDDAERRDAAMLRFGAAAARPSNSDVANEIARSLGWDPDGTEESKRAGARLVADWWDGTAERWDYSGAGWLRVFLLETQFARYWKNLLTFDLGTSTVHRVPVWDLILSRLRYSLTLALGALILAYAIAVPVGVLSARIHNTPLERAVSVVLFALYSLPSFFVGTLIVRFLAEGQPGSLEWIPEDRFESLDVWKLTTWEWIKDVAWHIAAPMFCMTYASLAALSRYAKGGVLNVIRSDYVRTARAKGLSEPVILVKHAARNGIIPVVTLLGGTLPVIVGGSFIIEFIFTIPGFGLLTIQSLNARDFNVVIGLTLVIAVLTMVGILLSDLLAAAVNPRISFS